MTTIGYARVSTDGQSLQSQTDTLHLAGCGAVYSEKQSGAYTDRPQLAKAIAALAEGDCLVVCKLDRLARSTRDLLNTLATISERGASFKSPSAERLGRAPSWRCGTHVLMVSVTMKTFLTRAAARREAKRQQEAKKIDSES